MSEGGTMSDYEYDYEKYGENVLMEYIGKSGAYQIIQKVYEDNDEILSQLSDELVKRFVVDSAVCVYLLDYSEAHAKKREHMIKYLGVDDVVLRAYLKLFFTDMYREYMVEKSSLCVLVDIEKMGYTCDLESFITENIDEIDLRASGSQVLITIDRTFEKEFMSMFVDESVNKGAITVFEMMSDDYIFEYRIRNM